MLAYLQIADPDQRRRLLDLAEVYADEAAAVLPSNVTQDNRRPDDAAVPETDRRVARLVPSEPDGTP